MHLDNTKEEDKDEWCNFKNENWIWVLKRTCTVEFASEEDFLQMNSVANKKNGLSKNKGSEWVNLQDKIYFHDCIVFENLGPPLWEFCVAEVEHKITASEKEFLDLKACILYFSLFFSVIEWQNPFFPLARKSESYRSENTLLSTMDGQDVWCDKHRRFCFRHLTSLAVKRKEKMFALWGTHLINMSKSFIQSKSNYIVQCSQTQNLRWTYAQAIYPWNCIATICRRKRKFQFALHKIF